MTSTFFMMCQSPAAFKKHSSYSRRAWEHLNAGFETAPALPALTQLVTLGSHPHPGENAVEFRSANLSRCLCRTLKQNAPLVIQLRGFFSTRDSLSYFLPSSDRPVPTTFKLCHFLFFSSCNVLSFPPALFFILHTKGPYMRKSAKAERKNL